jgi:hypothetical protein
MTGRLLWSLERYQHSIHHHAPSLQRLPWTNQSLCTPNEIPSELQMGGIGVRFRELCLPYYSVWSGGGINYQSKFVWINVMLSSSWSLIFKQKHTQWISFIKIQKKMWMDIELTIHLFHGMACLTGWSVLLHLYLIQCSNCDWCIQKNFIFSIINVGQVPTSSQ